MSAETELAADMLDGVPAISKFTGIPESRVYYLCDRELLPAFKIGTRWCALKSELRDALRSRRRPAPAKPPRRRRSAAGDQHPEAVE
jgi:hypothetical protein